MFYYYKSNIQN